MADEVLMPHSKRKRGQYKAYLRDPSRQIPRQTLARWRNEVHQDKSNKTIVDSVDNDDEGSAGEDQILENPNQVDNNGTSAIINNISHSHNYNARIVEDSDDEEWLSDDGSIEEKAESPWEEHYSEDESNSIPSTTSSDRVPLYEGCNITVEESELLILSYAVRHGLPTRALDDLIKLLNCHMPIAHAHPSRYKLLKKYKTQTPNLHYFCKVCFSLLEIGNSTETAVTCHQCEEIYDVISLRQSACYFLTLPLSDQIRSVIESEYGGRLSQNSVFSDVRNGTVYKKLVRDGVVNENVVTLQWNTDGVQLFKSSTSSVWPIQVVINELPYELQRSFIMLGGLWVFSQKPNMNTYLKPFVSELNTLYREGLECKIGGQTKIIRVVTLLSTVDSVARPLIQGLKQYNGAYGCSYCLNEGVMWDVGRGKGRVYLGDVGMPRTLSQHEADCEYRQRTGQIRRGVKGASVVMLLDVFNVVTSFVPEYMHSVLLGVVKTFVCAWFDSSNHGKPWYLGNKFASIDSLLVSIKPPHEVTRLPRSLKDRKLWKASEWRSFLLFYSPICMKEAMPSRYYRHWFLLVYSIHVFLREKITDQCLEQATNAIRKFVLVITKYYGECFMTFNVHLLLHLPKSVQRWGSLWSWSAFQFEHFNGVIRKLFHGTSSVPHQICRTYLRMKHITGIGLNTLRDEKCFGPARILFETLIGEFRVQNAHSLASNMVTFGAPRDILLTLAQRVCIEAKLGMNISHSCNRFKRFIYQGVLYHTTDYERLVKRHNSTVRLRDGSFVDITHVLHVSVSAISTKCVLLGWHLANTNQDVCKDSALNISSGSFCSTVVHMGHMLCFLPEEITQKCMKIELLNEKKIHVIPLPNKFERD